MTIECAWLCLKQLHSRVACWRMKTLELHGTPACAKGSRGSSEGGLTVTNSLKVYPVIHCINRKCNYTGAA